MVAWHGYDTVKGAESPKNNLRITKESLKIYREVYGSYSASKPTKQKYTFKKK